MIYLLLAIICSSSIALIFKYSEGNSMNRYVVTTSNYFIAFMVSLIISIKNNLFKFNIKISRATFSQQFNNVVVNNIGYFNNNFSYIWSVFIGIIAGVFFFLSFIYYQKSVKENGAGLSGAFCKLGILLPMTLSIVLWKEVPTILQWIGIILSIISIILVNISFKKDSLNNIKTTLVLLFFLGGMAEFSNKLFQKYANISYKSLFLFFVFFTAFIISLLVTLKKYNNFSKKDIVTGFIVGIPNLFSSYFLILSLRDMKTSVVFPIFSAGSIVTISVFGYLIFKEKLSKKELASIFMTAIALILINI